MTKSKEVAPAPSERISNLATKLTVGYVEWAAAYVLQRAKMVSSGRRSGAGFKSSRVVERRPANLGGCEEVSEELRKDYPIREGGFLKQLGGFDIYRSPNLIMAIVAVETQNGARDIRFYRWQLRKDKQSGEEAWKVDLARFSVRRFDFKDIAAKVERLKQLFP